ncbi:MAG: CinA family nicotinamide mononucleotide deamidase-related protein [Pseudomonadota bacterium]|nr:CinA family nicotinamide mononucleotide deamidase-related protein [Pseudomonadota bacterium]
MPRFDVISQGEELLSGSTVDTNAGWICHELAQIGLEPGRITVVGDVLDDIRAVFVEAAGRSSVVICTGGLGPTSDDLTSDAAAAAFGQAVASNPEALAQVEERYRSRKREMPPANRKQAMLPVRSTVLVNRLGTAPGFRMEEGGTVLYFLPGVPFEMKAMVAEHVIPELRARFALPPRRTVVLRCMGIAESVAGQKMEGFERPGVLVGFRANMPEVHVKLHLSPELDPAPLIAEVRERLGGVIFGVDTGPLAEVVGQHLRARGETIATAESCTAGRIAAALGAIAGASDYLLGGAVVYSNAEKVRQCGVDPDVLAAFGAVSEPVARALAEGIRTRVGATWGLAVTGIAGPGGGSPEKPVGTVHLALAGPSGTTHKRIQLPFERERVLLFTVGAALDLLRRAVDTPT